MLMFMYIEIHQTILFVHVSVHTSYVIALVTIVTYASPTVMSAIRCFLCPVIVVENSKCLLQLFLL